MGPRRTLSGLSAFPLASSEPTGQERPPESSEGELGAGRGHTTHLALATHSMVTSEVPATTLVFLGGMMMVGAMGSAGPPTSGERAGVSGDRARKSRWLVPWETFIVTEGSRWPRSSSPSSLRAESPDAGPRDPSPLLPLCRWSPQCPRRAHWRPPRPSHNLHNTAMPAPHPPYREPAFKILPSTCVYLPGLLLHFPPLPPE